MAVGNTFGATVLSSYGGFWISVAITFIPGGFKIMSTYEEESGGTPDMFYDAFGLMLWVSSFATCYRVFKKGSIADVTSIGLVHFHHIDHNPHAPIHTRILRSVLLRRPRYLATWYRLLLAQREGYASPRVAESRWFHGSARCLPGMVQCFRWYRRQQQQLLRGSCAALPLV